MARDDFLCIAAVRGQGALAGENIVAGDFLLLPASIAVCPITTGESGLEWLEIKLPSEHLRRSDSVIDSNDRNSSADYADFTEEGRV